MTRRFLREGFDGSLREIAGEKRGKERIVGQVAGQNLRVQIQLGIGQQHAEFGTGQPLAVARQGFQRRVGWQEFHRPVQPAARLPGRGSGGHGRRGRGWRGSRPPTAPGSGCNCPASTCRATSSVSEARKLLRLSSPSSPRITGPLSRIFRFTSWSEVSTPAELSTASVSMRPPLWAYFDAAQLGDAQIGAFAHHLGLDLVAVDAHGIVGAVARILVGLRRRP